MWHGKSLHHLITTNIFQQFFLTFFLKNRMRYSQSPEQLQMFCKRNHLLVENRALLSIDRTGSIRFPFKLNNCFRITKFLECISKPLSLL